MTNPRSVTRTRRAFTLIELTVVISVLLVLALISVRVVRTPKNYELGRNAGETLRTVFTAQRLYLADNPTTAVTSLTGAMLIPYMPNKATTMPTVKSLTGTTLNIKVTVFPPVVDNGTGGTYDPSGNSKDFLWDVGE